MTQCTCSTKPGPTKNLPSVQKSPITGEYYIPELIKIAMGQKQKVSVHRLQYSEEWQGISTREELVKAEDKKGETIGNKLMDNIQKIHMMGIGGSGMSGVACLTNGLYG